MVTVRLARPADAANVARILEVCSPIGEAFTAAEIFARMDHSIVLVAEIDGVVIGTSSLGGPRHVGTITAGPGGAFIYGSAVLPEYRRRGAYDALITSTIQSLARKGFTHVEYQALPLATGALGITGKYGGYKVPSLPGAADTYRYDISEKDIHMSENKRATNGNA